MAYAGDSPSKRIARGVFWLHAPKPTPEHPALVLAGEGGDVKVLNRLGVPRDAVVAVDTNPDAIAQCRSELGNIARWEIGDVGEVASRLDLKPSTALLDWCCAMKPTALEATFEVARRTTQRLGTVFMGGREHPKWMAYLCEEGEYLRAYHAYMRARFHIELDDAGVPKTGMPRLRGLSLLTKEHTLELGDYSEFWASLRMRSIRRVGGSLYFRPHEAATCASHQDSRFGALLRRHDGITAAIQVLWLHQNREAHPALVATYCGNQVPMAFSANAAFTHRAGYRRRRMLDFSHGIQDAQLFDFMAGVPLSLAACRPEDRMQMLFPVPRHVDEEFLRNFAVKLDFTSKELGAAFDVDPSRVAAWKAVNTRASRKSA